MIELRACAGEPELADARYTGEFASEMRLVAEQAHVAPWCGYVAWEADAPLGFGGFKTAPDADGVVEIGYLTFPDAQAKGVATLVAGGLVEIARASGARRVTAHTLPEPNASNRVLEKVGFVRDGWGEDDDVGAVWRWAINLAD